jgi:hypothetical protein
MDWRSRERCARRHLKWVRDGTNYYHATCSQSSVVVAELIGHSVTVLLVGAILSVAWADIVGALYVVTTGATNS